jgi:hypothetical protein
MNFFKRKSPLITDTTILTSGRFGTFIAASVISAVINLIFIGNLSNDDIIIGSFRLPPAVLMVAMSLTLECSKLLHVIQYNTLNELHRKLENTEAAPRIKSVSRKWFIGYLFYAALAILASLNFSVGNLGKTTTIADSNITVANTLYTEWNSSQNEINSLTKQIDSQKASLQSEWDSMVSLRNNLTAEEVNEKVPIGNAKIWNDYLNKVRVAVPGATYTSISSGRSWQKYLDYQTKDLNDKLNTAKQSLADIKTESSKAGYSNYTALQLAQTSLETDKIKNSGSQASFEILAKTLHINSDVFRSVMLLVLSLLVELTIYQTSPKVKISRKLLFEFTQYLPRDFNVNKFMNTVDKELIDYDIIQIAKKDEVEINKKDIELEKAKKEAEKAELKRKTAEAKRAQKAAEKQQADEAAEQKLKEKENKEMEKQEEEETNEETKVEVPIEVKPIKQKKSSINKVDNSEEIITVEKPKSKRGRPRKEKTEQQIKDTNEKLKQNNYSRHLLDQASKTLSASAQVSNSYIEPNLPETPQPVIVTDEGETNETNNEAANIIQNEPVKSESNQTQGETRESTEQVVGVVSNQKVEEKNEDSNIQPKETISVNNDNTSESNSNTNESVSDLKAKLESFDDSKIHVYRFGKTTARAAQKMKLLINEIFDKSWKDNGLNCIDTSTLSDNLAEYSLGEKAFDMLWNRLKEMKKDNVPLLTKVDEDLEEYKINFEKDELESYVLEELA